MTNREWLIKQMEEENEEELKDFVLNGFSCSRCPNWHNVCKKIRECTPQFVEWLRKEREEGET